MKHIALILMLVLVAGGCQRRGTVEEVALQTDTTFCLGANTELCLKSDGNLSQLELYYGGELQELMGTANTVFVRSDEDVISLDTLLDCGNPPVYVIRTADRTSTYGAEVWYTASPYRPGDTDGPWQLSKIASDTPTRQDVINLFQ